MIETFFICFRDREFSVDGFMSFYEAGEAICRECDKEGFVEVNVLIINEVRNQGQVVLPLDSNTVLELKNALRSFLKVGKCLCFECLPEVSKQMAL